MDGWSKHEGLALGLPLESIDTDQLIPARFMSTSRSEGYGQYLLHDLRRDEVGNLRPDFPLNQAHAAGASILVARRNFGSGSSREAAVYALIDAGFRAILAPSFGDIFMDNAVNNGLLSAIVDQDTAEHLISARVTRLEIDLEGATIAGPGIQTSFQIDPVLRLKLTQGWDDVDLTSQWQHKITSFAAERQKAFPWTWPERRPTRGDERRVVRQSGVGMDRNG